MDKDNMVSKYPRMSCMSRYALTYHTTTRKDQWTISAIDPDCRPTTCSRLINDLSTIDCEYVLHDHLSVCGRLERKNTNKERKSLHSSFRGLKGFNQPIKFFHKVSSTQEYQNSQLRFSRNITNELDQ